MDMSFADQALSVEYLVKNHTTLEKKVFPVPEELDKRVAKLKLESMGVTIDRLTSGAGRVPGKLVGRHHRDSQSGQLPFVSCASLRDDEMSPFVFGCSWMESAYLRLLPCASKTAIPATPISRRTHARQPSASQVQPVTIAPRLPPM